jgi:hypothetical protein
MRTLVFCVAEIIIAHCLMCGQLTWHFAQQNINRAHGELHRSRFHFRTGSSTEVCFLETLPKPHDGKRGGI